MRQKKGNSTRALLGLEGFTNYGIQTAGGELAVFLVQPTNISVLSHANVEIKIRHLLMVLSAPAKQWRMWMVSRTSIWIGGRIVEERHKSDHWVCSGHRAGGVRILAGPPVH